MHQIINFAICEIQVTDHLSIYLTVSFQNPLLFFCKPILIYYVKRPEMLIYVYQ